jgi:hypothetical protein
VRDAAAGPRVTVLWRSCDGVGSDVVEVALDEGRVHPDDAPDDQQQVDGGDPRAGRRGTT